MSNIDSKLVAYSAPAELPRSHNFKVRVKTLEGDWVELVTYIVRVDMHDVREAAMATFDFDGIVQVEIESSVHIEHAVIRPLSFQIPFAQEGNHKLRFTLHQAVKLSIEINGERFHNLHLFANALELESPDASGANVLVVEPGSYETQVLHSLMEQREQATDIIYLAPGLHRFNDGHFLIPSNTTVYIAGGAVVIGSFVCHHVENVVICGRGIVYLRDIEKTTYWRSVQIDFSRNIVVKDIISIDPPHYSIHLGQSGNVLIRNFKSFSTRGWCDGIDMMSCKNIRIEDVFLRTSDDCIAVYGSRGVFKGDTANVIVKDSILWADVAHPIMIGCHGDHEQNGDKLENLRFENIDILEHHEPQDGYWGCIAINVGDKNTVRHAIFRNIRIEQFELGRLFDIRVFHNVRYNPAPGERVEHIYFEDISFNGSCDNPSVIAGYDEQRIVDGVHFHNLRINGQLIKSAQEGNFECNEFQRNVTFSGDENLK